MPTQVTFSNAALADAIGKCARLAPRKGPAYDKAAGVLITVNPAERTATVRSTDLEVYYEQQVALLDGKGDATRWRIPSSIIQGIAANLPQAESATTEFIDRNDPSVIRFKSGNMVAKLLTIPPDEFPDMPYFSTDGMTPAQDLSQKVEQVSWATDPKSPIMAGVHMDGSRLIACNRHVMAVVPCEVALDKPVTVPLATLTALLKSATDIHVRATDTLFEIMLDEDTKALTRLLAGAYPNVNQLMREDFTVKIKCNKEQFTSTLDRLMVMVQNEKSPSLAVSIDGSGLMKMLTLDMEIQGTGRMQDSFTIDTDLTDTFKVHFVPKQLQDAVSKVRTTDFIIEMGHPDPAKSTLMPIRVTDGTGYFCYVSLRRPEKKED